MKRALNEAARFVSHLPDKCVRVITRIISRPTIHPRAMQKSIRSPAYSLESRMDGQYNSNARWRIICKFYAERIYTFVYLILKTVTEFK